MKWIVKGLLARPAFLEIENRVSPHSYGSPTAKATG